MDGYLKFLKSLSEYQQRSEIGHLVFIKGCCGAGPDLGADLLRAPAVAAFSETTLGIDSRFWALDLKHYAEEPDVIGAPVFDGDQCRAPFTFRYVKDIRHIEEAKLLHALSEDLVITGMIYIDDNQATRIGTLACSSTREKSGARERLIAAGIDPDTLYAVGHDVEMARKMPYLDYLEALLPQQRREAIFDLARLAWGTENPLFMSHPKLAPELARLEIRDLDLPDLYHVVGPVEFAGGQCTAPILYPLYGGGDYGNFFDSLGYYVEVHILAGIGNKSGGGGDIWVQDLWFRIESIDDPPDDTAIPLLVP